MNADFLTILCFFFKLVGVAGVCLVCVIGTWELLAWIFRVRPNRP